MKGRGCHTLGGGERERLLTGEARRRPPAGESSRLRPRGGLGERLLRRGGESLRDSLRRGGDAGLHKEISVSRRTVRHVKLNFVFTLMNLLRCSQFAT